MKKKNDCSKTTAIAPILEENKELKEEVKEMRVATQGEVTRENLQAFFENLHNMLWNRAGLSPERALEHMIFFFAYRMMELQADALQLPDICRWSYVAGLKSADDLYATLDHGTAYFLDNAVTSPFFKQHEIKSAEVVWDIIHEINRIPLSVLQETDTLGDIFEYMLSRGMSTMADEGQYYTNRKICRLAFILAYRIRQALRRTDGILCTFGDWFCGTGGFPAEYIRGVNQNLPDVDWTKDSASIYCQDMNMSSVTTTLLNILIQTGTPFNGVKKTIQTGNSFQQNITQGTGAIHRGLLLDYSFMNPPYGGDKSKGKAYKFAYSVGKGKDKRFLVNSDIQSIGVEDHDKVSAGVQLAMATLAPEGVCCIVLPQGFFFGASAKAVELRQKLTDEYKIHYVVDIASGSFINTGTKTSMLVFQKGVGPTDTIQFIGLDETVLVTATLDELRAKNYSLNYKQYLPQSAVEVDGFEMVKLGGVAKKLSTRGKHSAKDTVENGKYSLFSSSVNEIYALNTFDYPETCCIINSTNASGNAIVNLGINFSVTSDTFVFKCDNDITTKYLQLYLSSNIQFVKETFQGANHKHPTWDRLSEIQIPLPSIEKQQEIVDSIDGFTQLAHAEEQSLKLLEKSVMFEVKWMGMGKERVKLETIAQDITFGFMISSDDYGNEGVPVIKTKNIKSKRVLYPICDQKIKTVLHDKYRIKKGDIMIVLGGSPGETGMWEFDEEAWLNQDCAKISIENPITKMYVFYSLQGQSFDEYIEANTTKTTIGHISRGVVREIEISLPSLAEQQTLQSDFDEIRHKHAKIAEYKAKAQAAIQRLIPGANRQEFSTRQEPATTPTESHSSTCAVQEDGIGCTCRVGIMEEAELVPVEVPCEPVVAALPSSTQEASVTKKKTKRPVTAKKP